MNTRHIWAIARKDLREAMGNQSVWLPMIIVPVIFVVILPLVMITVMTQLGPEAVTKGQNMGQYLQNMPAGLVQTLAGMNEIQMTIVFILGYMFAPMFLILPLMFSTTIAAESFAGERERKTIEALLYSPATDSELFIGKMLAGLVPAVTISWISFIFYIIILNIASWPVFGRMWFPVPAWYPLIFWVSPALAVLGVSLTVLISTRIKTFMGAYQTSASTVLLIVALMVAQATGVLYLSIPVGLVIGLVFWIIAAVLLWFAIKLFNRKTLLASGD